MTYKQLIEKLNSLPPERLNDTVTVWDRNDGEFYPSYSLLINQSSNVLDTDVLDAGHPVLQIND